MKIKQKTWVLEKPLKLHWIRKITTREARTNDVNKVRGFLYWETLGIKCKIK